ncbi:hypothetical protein F5884DRAFT_825413 [Xylogone sp. PMI_703]|nr:hypothetical protein F5884DRAFT_825413 [Xylogone sp. PMI_703]
MEVSQDILVPLGVLAVLCKIALLNFNIVFAVTFSDAYTGLKNNTMEIVASVLNFVNISLLSILLAKQFQYHNGIHIQDIKQGRQPTCFLAGFCEVFCTFLYVIRKKIADLPRRTLSSSTESLVTSAFVVWAISLVSEIVFIIAIILIQKMSFHQQMQLFQIKSGNHSLSKIKKTARKQDQSSSKNINHRKCNSLSTSPSSLNRRLSVRNPLLPESLDSKYHNRNSFLEYGFNSWNTSAGESYTQQAVLRKSLLTPKFLEAIPPTPTNSRSPSPGIPLDLEPASRSQPNSYTDVIRKSSRVTSPNGSLREAQIHPLSRSDSPTPPSAAAPGTVVTATLSAGQVISDYQSIRSLRHISGSLPNSPLEDCKRVEEEREERRMTPPISDWILGQGPRSSLASSTTSQVHEGRIKTDWD